MGEPASKVKSPDTMLPAQETWTDPVQQPMPSADPFRLGFRYRRGPDIEPGEMVPLTPDDLLYPEEGDVVSEGLPHFLFLQPLVDALRRFFRKRVATHVTSNVTLVLGDGRNAGPDIAVIEGEIDVSAVERAVHLKKVGARLTFVLEAVSTSDKEIEKKDLEGNLKRYAAEGVSEYFTVYPTKGKEVRDLVGRELRDGGYVEIVPDGQGRICSQKLGLWFSIDASSRELVIVDAATGKRLRSSEEETEARRQAEERGVRDLCSVLGLGWSDEREDVLTRMTSSELDELRRHLLREKSWPPAS